MRCVALRIMYIMLNHGLQCTFHNINVSTHHALTVADGITVRESVDFALECMKGLVDEVVAVDESMIVESMKFCQRHFGLVVFRELAKYGVTR